MMKLLFVVLALCILNVVTSHRFFASEFREVPDPQGCGADSGVECPVCAAEERSCYPRVRRNWNNLTDDEKRKYIRVLHIMKWTSTSEGRKIYGDQFVSYDELVMKHAASSYDPRGDQGHLDQVFVVYHKMLTLEFENSMLAIEPSLMGAPYMEWREGIEGVFHSGELGMGVATGPGENYEIDGAFANWTVSEYDVEMAKSRDVDWLFKDLFDDTTGVTRMRKSPIPTANIVRYPKCDETIGPAVDYTDYYYNMCVQEEKQFVDFYWCLFSKDAKGIHGLAHYWLGSVKNWDWGFGCLYMSYTNLTEHGAMEGDFVGSGSSINDPFFFLHHSWMDLMFQDFARQHYAGRTNYWNYMALKHHGDAKPHDGTLLYDVLGSIWPYTGALVLDQEDAPKGPLRIWEVLCWVGAYTAPFTYDKFDDDLICANEDFEIDFGSLRKEAVGMKVSEMRRR